MLYNLLKDLSKGYEVSFTTSWTVLIVQVTHIESGEKLSKSISYSTLNSLHKDFEETAVVTEIDRMKNMLKKKVEG